jgi:hypothetical protein
MPKAVRFAEYGGSEVLKVVEVERPVPGPGRCSSRWWPPGSARARP